MARLRPDPPNAGRPAIKGMPGDSLVAGLEGGDGPLTTLAGLGRPGETSADDTRGSSGPAFNKVVSRTNSG